MERLHTGDPLPYELITRAHRRQAQALSIADPAVLACEGTALLTTTTEEYSRVRFDTECEVVDPVGRIAIERAHCANVQPHSGTSASQRMMFALLRPGATALGLHVDAGGHLSHGAKGSVSGTYFRAVAYGGRRLIIFGANSYPRTIDLRLFRFIADEAGAFLLADISHLAGLVAAGEHSSPSTTPTSPRRQMSRTPTVTEGWRERPPRSGGDRRGDRRPRRDPRRGPRSP